MSIHVPKNFNHKRISYIVGEMLFSILTLIIRSKETGNHLEQYIKIFHEQHLSFW